jgi:hypothetical protein
MNDSKNSAAPVGRFKKSLTWIWLQIFPAAQTVIGIHEARETVFFNIESGKCTAYVAWRAGTIRQPYSYLAWFLAPIDSSKIPAQNGFLNSDHFCLLQGA